MLGQGVEGDVGARALSVVVGAAKLGASCREATTGSDGGQSGTDSGGGVHLCSISELAVIAEVAIAVNMLTLKYRGERMDDREWTDGAKVNIARCAWDNPNHMIFNPVT